MGKGRSERTRLLAGAGRLAPRGTGFRRGAGAYPPQHVPAREGRLPGVPEAQQGLVKLGMSISSLVATLQGLSHGHHRSGPCAKPTAPGTRVGLGEAL